MMPTSPQGPDGRIRVAYVVSPSTQFAGIESVTHEIAHGLALRHSDALDVHVVYCNDYGDNLPADSQYTKHVLGIDRLARLPSRLRAWVQAWEVDVLVVPQVEATVLSWLATRGLRLPVLVSHLHGNPSVEELDGTWRTRALFKLYRGLVTRDLASVWTVSPSLASHLSRELSNRLPVQFVPNPARQLGTPTDWVPGDGSRWRLVSVGRLSRQKGHDVLLEALAIARPDLPATRLTLVGGGPDEAALRARCARLGLSDVVDFVGYVDPAVHLRHADCFVFPSRWEGFGMVLVEALQFGLPVVAADCDFGPADVISDPRIGDLVLPDNPEALARGLVQVSRRPRLDDHVAARARVADAFRPEHAVTAHLAALRGAAAHSSAASLRLKAFSTQGAPGWSGS